MTILEEAEKLTSVDRQEVYSHPAENFKLIMELAEPILKSNIDPKLKHALYMIQVKVARLLNSPTHRDSIVDIAGYANTYAMIVEKLSKSKEGSSGK